jgi:hypothetical protein
VRFQEIFEEYQDRVQFLNIYIREAHPKDGWWLGLRLTKKPVLKYAPKVSMDYYDPKDISERRSVAADCTSSLDYTIPTLVDGMDDQVNKAYAAWPTRLYLVGLDGRVVYAGGMAPYNYKPAEFKAAIEDYLKSI